ncbi:hypothetical protein JCM9140_4318 [Halalkalibacter wakoensis JCM 9140]|uniref:DUF3895 domain-containing protein n=1 Tax=Halalkalibacter wakoensis JCM 9140 TaxID=1236970 RepID=W4Q8V9_9BACI|nr:DUF3895 domain-containing protein [Halalkalibacter wakoensis]GAE28123.1 hypothetical protein JCM9140_4318 [Halalkalibacter wakoensis JCM 9140]
MLSTREKEVLNDYVHVHSTFTLNDVCNYLIENGSTSQTYSTGKYKIYPYVAVFLESYVSNSILEINHLENDAQYKVVGTISKENETEKEIERKEEVKEDEPQLGQLSLF